MNKDRGYLKNEKEINNLHYCLKLLAQEVFRICGKYDIKCFIIGGTLLGSIRHKDIIPWDDDLDIGMLRDDYQKFLAYAEKEIDGNRFYLTSMYNNKNYGLNFTKIKLKDTVFKEQTPPKKLESNIFVDIFPIDVFPDDEKEREKIRKRLRFYGVLLLVKSHYKVKSKYILIWKLLSLIFRRSSIINKIDYEETKYNGYQSQYFINYGSSYNFGRELFPRQSLTGELDTGILGDLKVHLPKSSKQILSMLYGDYMTPPPEEKRNYRHSSGDLNFGPYEILENNQDIVGVEKK